jgi:hypothetical protein
VVEELIHDTKIEDLNPETNPLGERKQSAYDCGLGEVGTVIGKLTYVDKLKDLNLETAAPGRGRGESKCLRLWARGKRIDP